MSQHPSLAFVGGGNMAAALIRGLVGTRTFSRDHIIAADPDDGRLSILASDPGVRTTNDNVEAIRTANIVVLAVKPQVFRQVLPDLVDGLRADALVISIAAGVSTAVIEAALPEGTRVIRTMPNTPALAGLGATAVAGGTHATGEDRATASTLFESVGVVVQVPESQMDAVTGLSGSGPAYVFAMIEALRDAGIQEGLDAATAETLAAQTVRGAAELLLTRDETPEALRQKVTSPGGTTLAGLTALDKKGFRDAVVGAVRAATRRSTELGHLT